MFLEAGGEQAIITNPEGALASLAGKAGTRIVDVPKEVITWEKSKFLRRRLFRTR